MSDNQSMHIEDTPKNGDSAGHEQNSQKSTVESFLSFFQSDLVKAVCFIFGVVVSLGVFLLIGFVSVVSGLFMVGDRLNTPIKAQISSFESKIDNRFDRMDEQNEKFQKEMIKRNEMFENTVIEIIKTSKD